MENFYEEILHQSKPEIAWNDDNGHAAISLNVLLIKRSLNTTSQKRPFLKQLKNHENLSHKSTRYCCRIQ
jgi:hypothetical protein